MAAASRELEGLFVAERAGMARAHHVGHSMGGYVVQELAFRRPDRVRSMVMLSTT